MRSGRRRRQKRRFKRVFVLRCAPNVLHSVRDGANSGCTLRSERLRIILLTSIITTLLTVVVVFFKLTDRASTYPVIYVVANPVRGHKEVPKSTSHIMVTTRYSDQQGSKSQQKVMRLYKQWHRPISKRFIKHPYSIHREQPRSARIVVAYPRPAFSATNWTPLVMYYSVVMFGGSA